MRYEIWGIIGLLFIFVEMITLDFVLVFFGAFALLTMFSTLMGLTTLNTQLVVFGSS